MKEKKLKILQAAINLFIQYGYKKTTLDDLAESTGLKKSTLYHYFAGKEELFREVVEFVYLNHIEEINRALFSEQDVLKALLKMLDQMERTIKRFSPSLKALVGEHDEILKFIEDLFEEHVKSILDVVSERINKGVEDGQLDASIDSLIISEIILNFYSVVFKRCQFSDFYKSISGNREEYLQVLLKPYLVDAA